MDALKEELKELIDQEDNLDLLAEVKTILTEKHLDPAMKEWMTKRALQAEEDYKAGRVYTIEEAFSKVKEFMKK